jgi:hypothetical protein
MTITKLHELAHTNFVLMQKCFHNAKFRDYAMYDARQSPQQLFQAVDVYLTEIKFAAAKRQKASERIILHD